MENNPLSNKEQEDLSNMIVSLKSTFQLEPCNKDTNGVVSAIQIAEKSGMYVIDAMSLMKLIMAYDKGMTK